MVRISNFGTLVLCTERKRMSLLHSKQRGKSSNYLLIKRTHGQRKLWRWHRGANSAQTVEPFSQEWNSLGSFRRWGWTQTNASQRRPAQKPAKIRSRIARGNVSRGYGSKKSGGSTEQLFQKDASEIIPFCHCFKLSTVAAICPPSAESITRTTPWVVELGEDTS